MHQQSIALILTECGMGRDELNEIVGLPASNGYTPLMGRNSKAGERAVTIESMAVSQESDPVVQVDHVGVLCGKLPDEFNDTPPEQDSRGFPNQVCALSQTSLYQSVGVNHAALKPRAPVKIALASRADDSPPAECKHGVWVVFEAQDLCGDAVWGQKVVLTEQLYVTTGRRHERLVEIGLRTQVRIISYRDNPLVIKRADDVPAVIR
jgi:hypothetical protein